ncbi:hypothetical protein GCM10027184_00090 [Saccharothrix stipae]
MHSVRAIGPTTWSFGARRALSQPHTFDVDGLADDATCRPDESVRFIVVPDARRSRLKLAAGGRSSALGWEPKLHAVTFADRRDPFQVRR